MVRSYWCLFLVTLLTGGLSSQQTLHVALNSPPGGNGTTSAPFASIQTAIQAAGQGDLILVGPGTFFEHLNFLGKGITVRSAQGAFQTRVDGSSIGTVVTFANGEGFTSQLEGFTIQNGRGLSSATNQSTGGGVHISAASPVILNCIFSGNIGGSGVTTGEGAGGGISIRGSSGPVIVSCRFNQNIGGNGFTSFFAQAAAGGGGLHVNVGAPFVLNCTFFQNVGGNLIGSGGFGRDAGGGAISITSFGVCNLANSTLFANTGGSASNPNQGASGGINIGSNGLISAVNCIIRGNIQGPGSATPPQVAVSPGNPAPAQLTYSNVEGGFTGIGNFNADPLFVSGTTGDFHIQHGSPCVNAGNNNINLLFPLDYEGDARIFDQIVDVGADELDGLFDSCGRGTVANGTIDTLKVNGSGGGAFRGVVVGVNQPLTISIDTAPGFVSADFLLFGQIGLPDAADSFPTPWGTMCLIPSVLGPADHRFIFTSSLDPLAGFMPSFPTPWSFSFPFGLPLPGTLSFQAVLIKIHPSFTDVALSNAIAACIL